jgi:hypothetical protein
VSAFLAMRIHERAVPSADRLLPKLPQIDIVLKPHDCDLESSIRTQLSDQPFPMGHGHDLCAWQSLPGTRALPTALIALDYAALSMIVMRTSVTLASTAIVGQKLKIAAVNKKARSSFEAGLFRLKMVWR